MPIYHINTGTSPNSGNGDVLRTAFWKTNLNFQYLNNLITSGTFASVATDIIPAVNNTYSLGSPDKQWKHIFVSTGSIYLGDVKLSTDNGQLQIQTVVYEYNTVTNQITTETVTSGYAAPTVVPDFTVTNTLTVGALNSPALVLSSNSNVTFPLGMSIISDGHDGVLMQNNNINTGITLTSQGASATDAWSGLLWSSYPTDVWGGTSTQSWMWVDASGGHISNYYDAALNLLPVTWKFDFNGNIIFPDGTTQDSGIPKALLGPLNRTTPAGSRSFTNHNIYPSFTVTVATFLVDGVQPGWYVFGYGFFNTPIVSVNTASGYTTISIADTNNRFEPAQRYSISPNLGTEVAIPSTGTGYLYYSGTETNILSWSSGGVSNTGDITFSGIKIIGADVGSGSGDIELVPDNSTSTYYNSGQYIRIYPTRAVPDAPHIHIAAGSGGDLMLGDDQRSVDVNHDNNIYIRTDQYGGAYNWKFDTNGSLVGPTLTTTGWLGWDTVTVPTLRLGTANTSPVVITNSATDSSYINATEIQIRGQRGYGFWNNNSGSGGIGTNLYFWAGAGGESSTANAGGEGGNIYIHGGMGQGGGYGGDIEIEAGPAAYTNNFYNSSTNAVVGGHVNIISGDAISDVTAGTGTGGQIKLRAGRGNTANGEIQFETSSNSSTWEIIWKFKNDGSTTFPTLTVPISDNVNPSGTGQTIKFSDPSQQAIIYGPPADATYTSAQRIILQGAPGLAGTNGEGGDIYLWAGAGGNTDGNGGDIKIRAGRGYGTAGGGYLNFQAGNAVNTGAGGWINIESGSSGATGQGGYINVNANSGGYIRFQTYDPGYYGTTEWYMKKNGVTRFPLDTIAGEGNNLTIATKNFVLYDFLTAYFETGSGLVNGLSGQNAHSFTCTIQANQDGTYSIITYNPGSGWTVGNTLTIMGGDLGGTAPANNLTLTIDAVGGSGEILTLTPSGTAVGKQWIFDTDGSTNFASGLNVLPVSAYSPGAPFNGTIITQTSGTLLQVVARGVGGASAIGWLETPNSMTGGIASINFNDVANSVSVTAGSFDTTLYNWKFNADGTTEVPGTIKSAVVTGDVVINASNGTTSTWTFNGDGSTTFPNGAKLNNGTAYQFATDNGVVTSLDLRDANGRGFYTNSDGYTLRSNGTYNWIFDTNGRTRFPALTAPTHSYGAAGDTAGMVAFDNAYIYYCTANYVNTSTNIWKRVALDATPW